MRKFILLVLVIAAGVAVPVARADQPTTVPLPPSDLVDSTCGYPINVHFTLPGEGPVARIFSDGDILITGGVFTEFSANGKTVSMTSSGPAIIRANPDGSFSVTSKGVSSGRLQTANGVILAIFAGPVTVSPTTGLPTLEHGTILVNVCTALAP